MKSSRWLTSFLAVMLLATGGRAAVADSSANGFTVKLTFDIAASPDDVYRKLLHNIGDWWNPQHTFSGDAHNLSIDERAMGCFCEKLPNQGQVRHLEVVNIVPGKKLVMIGGLGPMQSMAATGSLTITLTGADKGTKLDLTYAVTGYSSIGMNSMAVPSDGMLTEQMTRLKNYVEKGRP